MSKQILTIHTGDIHLTDKKPLARVDEPDWYKAQFRVLEWLMKYKQGSHIVIGGDLFDSPSISFKLLNQCSHYFSAEYCTAVIGNHEQPNKNEIGVEDSVFTTGHLMSLYTGIIQPKILYIHGVLYGFIPASNSEDFFLKQVQMLQNVDVIVMHKFVWYESDNKIPDSLKSSHAHKIQKLFPNAKVIFTSDNHRQFSCIETTPKVYNCGMLIRDNADLVNYQPYVFQLYDDFSVEQIKVPIESDLITNKHLVEQKVKLETEQIFIKTLDSVKSTSISFYDNLINRLENQRSKSYIINTYTNVIHKEK